uniref:Cation/H+ exchanger domain-containing protein n=1 Tax=Romanomermis culicivorax TaxID=13658 RepID=A0A915JIM8_ROMCU
MGSESAENVEKIAEIKAVDLHKVDSINLMLYTLLLTCTVLTIWFFKRRRLRFVHETGLTLVYGLIVGLIMKFTSSSSSTLHHLNVIPLNDTFSTSILPDYLRIQVAVENNNNTWFRYRFEGPVQQSNEALIEQKVAATFDPEIFFNLILPPIIFNAGYSLKKRHFFRNIGSILMFAILGTTISCVITGFFMYAVMLLSSLNFTLNDSLLFGAIISATDPVTVLAIFNDIHVDVDLFALVFGESALNDAVAIVLTSTIERFNMAAGDGHDITLTSMSVLSSCGEFLGVFFGSLGIGMINGCGAALLTKFTKISEFPLLETSLFILSSYLSFLMAEAGGMTGLRGAVAFALAIRNTATPERRIVYTTTSLIAIFTVLVNGGLTSQMIQWLKIKYGVDEEMDPQSPSTSDSNAKLAGNTKHYNPWDKSFLPRKWYNFDSKYLKPFLTNSRPTLMDTTPTCLLPVARLFTTTQQMNEGLPVNAADLIAELESRAESVVDDSFAYQSFAPAPQMFDSDPPLTTHDKD